MLTRAVGTWLVLMLGVVVVVGDGDFSSRWSWFRKRVDLDEPGISGI